MLGLELCPIKVTTVLLFHFFKSFIYAEVFCVFCVLFFLPTKKKNQLEESPRKPLDEIRGVC